MPVSYVRLLALLAGFLWWLWGSLSEPAWTAERHATPVGSIRAPAGFRVELLRSAQEGEGSWISLAFDPQGRLLVGRDDLGVARLTLADRTPADGAPADGAPAAGRKLVGQESVAYELLAGTESLRHVRGLLYAHRSIYICATDSQAVYRMRDLSGEGEYQSPELFQAIAYQSRYGHGVNQVVLGPDQMLYFVCGNDVVFPPDVDPASPYRGARNDWLLPNPADSGHDDRVGYVARVDPEGKSWQVLAGGLRNPFDIAIDRNGEIFTWDADMEWDVGLPWYRPTRINHIVSGGEYGWRWGTGKWPAWYPDSLPSTLDTGLSSPTGLVFGYQSRWPHRYREALFMADWQLGRILMVDLVPKGASYEATAQLFLEGAPLNVCDMTFGPDGALYFITGGRGSQSGLYRVDWIGDAPIPPPPQVSAAQVHAAESARQERRWLEQFHVRHDPEAIDRIRSSLGSDDPWLRYAARLALENQPPRLWRDSLAQAESPAGQRMALLALARAGLPTDQPRIIETLLEHDWTGTDEAGWLDLLRTAQLTLIRHGDLSEEARLRLLGKLSELFPHRSFPVNWLLAELLVRLDSPDALPHILELLESAVTQEEQFQYVKTLVRVSGGWDDERARRIGRWFERSRDMHGGKLVESSWRQLREELAERLSAAGLGERADELRRLSPMMAGEAATSAGARPVVRHWQVDELIDDVLSLSVDTRSSEAGERALAAANCLQCHRWGTRGGQTGPDLTDVGKRFDGRALLESILEPSRQIDPKYLNPAFLLDDGRVVTGRAVGVNDRQLVIEVDPLSGRTESIDRRSIEATSVSQVSPMPAGLLDILTRDEILDLIALLRR